MSSFPIALTNTADFAGPLPEAVDVAIIGGGIIGVMTAWALRKKGLSVLVCEKGRVAGEQSSRNWGWIRQQGRDYAELPIMVDTIRIWKALDEKLRTGIGFKQSGITYLARNEAKLAEHEKWLAGARAYGVDTRLLTRRETEAMLPNSANWVGAMTTPSDAMAEPFVAVPVLAHAAVESGVIIREDCAVRSLDIAGGKVQGVFTEHGRVRCERVVVAAGVWSSLLLANHGIRIPQLGVVSSVISTQAMQAFFPAAACDDRFAIRRRADGGYTLTPWSTHDFFIGPDAFRNLSAYLPQLRDDFRSTHFSLFAPKTYPDAWGTRRRWTPDEQSPFERCRILHPRPNETELNKVLASFAAAFPVVGKPQVRSTWAGMIDTMPDLLPLVDRAPINGVTIATGMSGHGFGIGPGMAEVIADLVQERSPKYNLSAFRLGR
ncbi:FAD-binding oxidoreductase [Tianweitania sp. BSSL-BM11]|uniref:FAD-binding oxidoreductase n=1 Tax=Tianweitania aestuarii TaxID=2814886 RepID=A0ABS5RWI8_9HYPH|nr:FAD-dependent oxidoreductase [Tianweitania aestuarii]MBS9721145.1 FAD-binding oxidoreductase [Tianweitania aestuarii]